MEQNYNDKMSQQGYSHLVCDIFAEWENVKDEILLNDRKNGSGNGTIHVFLGSADKILQEEFSTYYDAVESGIEPSIGAIPIKHYFMVSNVLSMLGFVCKYLHEKNEDSKRFVIDTLGYLNEFSDSSGLLSTTSVLKLSTGSNRLRPYFKKFESDGVFPKVIRQILVPKSSYKISLYKNDAGEYAAFWLIGFDWLGSFDADSSTQNLHQHKTKRINHDLPHQQIFYGAPGTGKSHGVEEAVKRYGMTAIRTTFHPDSDYSTFVGAYKPQMEAVVLRDYRGEPVQKDGSEVSEKRIVYKFTQQAFLKAYIAAWKNLRRPHVLVIEEINRGNCAQIFGDLFQLLDRDEAGFSKYPIEADTDIKEALEEAFKGLQKTDIAVLHGDTTADDITSGQRLVLPNNLYIWATMNTSDQSLFPIDSAFKRRWEWKYVPISDAGMGWRIAADGAEYDWWSFVERINDKIWDATQSEDKKLGYFFCKADRKRHGGDTENTIISADQFVGKVLFYLYNDVFKNYCFDDDTFQDLPFQSYFKPDGSPQEETVAAFLKRLGVAEIRPADNNGGNKTAED